MPPQDTMHCCIPWSAVVAIKFQFHSKMFTIFEIKIDDVTVKHLTRRIQELNSPKEELTLTIICQIDIMVQI